MAAGQIILQKGRKRSWNSADRDKEIKEETKEETEEEINTDEANADGEQEETIDSINLQRLYGDDQYATMLASALDPDVDVEHETFIETEAVRSALQSAGGSLSQAAVEARRAMADLIKFIEWCQQPRLLRPYYLKKTVVDMQRVAGQLSFQFPPTTTTATAMYKALQEFLVANPGAEPTEGDAAPSIDSLSKEDKLLQAMLASSFLKKQEGTARAETRRGLALETPLARQLMANSENGMTTPFKLNEIASVPLVMRTGINNNSIVGSTDFVASAEIKGSKKRPLLLLKSSLASRQALQNVSDRFKAWRGSVFHQTLVWTTTI